MIAAGGRVLAEGTDVGLVAINEWATRYFSACIFWMDCGF